MYTHYESRQDKQPRDYDRSGETYDTISPTTASTTYRSSVGPRVTNVQRSRATGLGAGGVSTRMFQSYLSSGNTGNFGPSLAGVAHFPGVPLRGGTSGGNNAVATIHTNRQRDKRDLELLNDKFAQYVEKVS
jgi:hypothetical protein